MKKFLLISIFIFNSLMFAQLRTDAPEIYMWTSNVPAQEINTFILQKLSTSYCFDRDQLPTIEFVVCEDCQPCNDCDGGSTTVVGTYSSQKGWSICSQQEELNFESYGWGAYRLYLESDTTKCIYLDLRDADYATSDGPDFRIRYNKNGFGNGNYYEWDAEADNNWVVIDKYANIWSGRGSSYPNTLDFPSDFWENSLAADETPIDYPTLILGKERNSSVTKYRLFRAISNNEETPSTNAFTWIGEFDINDLFYQDETIYFDENTSKFVHYFAESYVNSTFSKRTNFVKSYFLDLDWSKALILTQDNNRPRIVWGPYPDDEFEVTHYRIYRRVELGNWNLCAVVNSSTFEFIDSEVSLSSKVDRIDYYVKAYNGSTESSATNTVTVIGQYNPNKETAGKNIEENIREISLDCYPNPFNPTTVISYQLASDSYITLKVFDLLGREITTLAEGFKQAGKYEATYTAEDLPSGTYIYTLNVNGKVFSRKMQLIK